MMKKFIWVLRATLFYKASVPDLRFSLAWSMSDSLWHSYEAADGETEPRDAVDDDLSYWD